MNEYLQCINQALCFSLEDSLVLFSLVLFHYLYAFEIQYNISTTLPQVYENRYSSLFSRIVLLEFTLFHFLDPISILFLIHDAISFPY